MLLHHSVYQAERDDKYGFRPDVPPPAYVLTRSGFCSTFHPRRKNETFIFLARSPVKQHAGIPCIRSASSQVSAVFWMFTDCSTSRIIPDSAIFSAIAFSESTLKFRICTPHRQQAQIPLSKSVKHILFFFFSLLGSRAFFDFLFSSVQYMKECTKSTGR